MQSESVEKSGITILCREVNTDTGEIASYLCKKNVTDHDLLVVRIRTMTNEGLSYYAITTACANNETRLAEYLKLLKKRRLTDGALKLMGGIERL